ncbi:hypothetical protein TNCV_298811 [Trichonephila clavipes]|nr:hypothetical protein TNCV_298811 [Trichonephila clavipes]
MYDEFQGGDGPRTHLKKSVSYDSSSLPSLCANTFCEELADALLQRASSLRTFHPSVIVGREERFIESLIDLARAIRPAAPEPEEKTVPQQGEKKKFSRLRSDEQGGQATSPTHLIHRAEYVSFKKLWTLLEKCAGAPWCINNMSF